MSVGTTGLKKGLASASDAISSFKGSVTSSVGSAMAGFATLGLAINGIKATLGALATPLSLAADTEQTAVSFKVLLGSAEKAETVMADLKKFAASTPFEFPELAKSGKQLLAFGVNAESLVPTLTRLGDVSAGLGIPLNELSEIYGKAKVQGRLMMEDINQLQGRGINVTSQLAKQFGVTEEAVRSLVSGGKVNFGNLEQAFISMTGKGGQFAGMMEAQSQTMSGLWSTAKDTVNAALTKIGDTIIKTFDLKGTLTGLMGWADKVMPIFDNVLLNIQNAIISFKPYLIQFVTGFQTVIGTIIPYVTQFASTIGSRVSELASTWLGGISSLTGGSQLSFESFLSGLTSVLDTVTPIVSQAFNTWMGFQKVMVNAFFSGLEIIKSAFSSLMGYVSNSFLPSWQTVKSFILDALLVIEFGLSHWKDIAKIAFNEVLISVVAFAGNVKHFFTDVIPTYVLWLADNWQNILHDMGEATFFIFKNLGSNIVAIFKNIPKLIKGEVNFADLWTPLTEGAIFALKGLPDVPERVMGDFEKSLRKEQDKMKSGLSDDFGKFYQDRMKELEPPKAVTKGLDAIQKKADEVKKAVTPDVTSPLSPEKGKGKLQLASAAEFGGKDARQSILRFQFGGDPMKDMAKVGKQQLSVLQQLPPRLDKIAEKREEVLDF